jgi:5-methylcytosine-specific restriction endonuclease McrA
LKKSRASKGVLYPPATLPIHSLEQQRAWLDKAVAGFVTPGAANRSYYELILRRLWPEGHGIPGPHVSEEDMRSLINGHRAGEGKKPYADPFRRLRELQGDEGFTSIIKSGRTYQLQSTEIGPKREPRSKPTKDVWNAILEAADHRCAKCGQREPDVKLSPDHRRPRGRGGTGADENWQPLCEQCNILKSAACAGCTRNCYVCFWAYPETYAEITISDDNRAKLRTAAEASKMDQTGLANEILRRYFLQKK